MSEQQAQQLTPELVRDARKRIVEILACATSEWGVTEDDRQVIDSLLAVAARVAGCPDEGRRDVTEGASVPLTVSEALVLYDALTGRDVGIQRNEHYLTGFRKLHEARLRLSPQMGTGA